MDIPSRGRKQCSDCKAYVPCRTSQCECGHVFYEKKTVSTERVFSDAPSRGRKQCGGCRQYVGVRTQVCVCGYSFSTQVACKVRSSYDEAGRGRKQCQQCKQFCGVRSHECPCGAKFPVKGEETEIELPKSQDRLLAEAVGYGHYNICNTPAHKCPVRLRGTDTDRVSEWVSEVMVDTNTQTFYGLSALLKWVSGFYPRYVVGVNGENPDFMAAAASLRQHLSSLVNQ